MLRAARDHVMAAQRAAGRDRMQAVDADRVGGPDDRGDVVRLVHGVQEHREVGLPTVERALELRESLGCHRPAFYARRPTAASWGSCSNGVGCAACFKREIEVATKGRGTYELTRRVADAVRSARVTTGLCHVFTTHTSASLMICENADPDVRRDLETFMADLAPDGDSPLRAHGRRPRRHAAHVRSVLTQVRSHDPDQERRARARHVAGRVSVGAPPRRAPAARARDDSELVRYSGSSELREMSASLCRAHLLHDDAQLAVQ